MRLDRDEVLARVDLEDLANSMLGPSHPRTRSWRCPNPSHAQTGRTPPVSIFQDRFGGQRWYCHGCGDGGTAIDLAMRAGPATDFREALVWLADRANVSPTGSLPARRTSAPAMVETAPDDGVLRALRDYAHACAEHLFSPAGRQVRHWLTDDRAIPAEVLLRHGVGADPGPTRLPRPPGFPRAFPAAVFPVYVDRQVAFTQSRLLRPVDHRWLSLASSVAPNPRVAILGGSQHAGGTIVVTEGMVDGLSVVAGGQRAAVLLGAAVVGDQTVDKVARSAAQVVIATDNDDAGQRCRQRLGEMLAAKGVPFSNLEVPPRFKDVNDWHQATRSHWPQTLKSALQLSTCRPTTRTPPVVEMC